jgi:zinc transport system permease protein
MIDFIAIFKYQFFQNAMMAALLTSLLAGMIGTYIVSRKIVFITDGITHASFGGIGMAYYLGLNPLLGAGVFAVLSAVGIEWVSHRGKLREDSAIAILWSLGMAVGIIFVFITPGYTPDLMSFLFGSILSVGGGDLLVILGLTLFTALFMGVFYRPILYSAFDPEFSKIMGVPVAFFRYTMSVLIALAIVVSIRSMGIILVLSLYTIPQATAMLFSHNFARIIPISIIFGLTGSMLGLFSAYGLNIPSGAAIIFILIIQYLIFKVIMWIKGRVLRSHTFPIKRLR